MDFNSDGRKDLLVGESLNGFTYVFLNEGTDEDPVLGIGEALWARRSGRSAPFAVDWDLDGRKDLLVGQKDGKILLLINDNTDEDPYFPVVLYVLAGVEELDVGERSNPEMFDWDNDGKSDILTGEYDGEIFFYTNIGTNSDPDFGPSEKIAAGGMTIDVGSASRIDIVDWNSDGLLDILSGSYDGMVRYYEQEFLFRIESISYDPVGGTTLGWRSRPDDLYRVEYSDDLVTWYEFPEAVPSQGLMTEWTDHSSVALGHRYYRVVLADE